MSRSILQSKWMRKNYSNPYVSYTRRNMKDSHRNPHRLDEVSKNRPSRYITTHCKNQIHWLQESTSFGGHSIPKGGHRQVMVNRFERDRRIRDAYIKANNGVCKCAICGFDFESFYGDLGKGFIHMHHMKPLSEIRQEQQTKFEDLILVCPNCHAMLHRAKPMLTPEQLKKRINDNCKDNDA